MIEIIDEKEIGKGVGSITFKIIPDKSSQEKQDQILDKQERERAHKEKKDGGSPPSK
jgi:hypothetical protein